MMNRALYLVLGIKLLILGWIATSGAIGLGPDEAQYWTWSQALDWGYYSKPPGIAWEIWIGTRTFGNTLFGVRAVALLLGTLLPLAVYWMARQCGFTNKTACWSGIVMALTPLGMMGTLLTITDTGMVFFWTLACGMLCRAWEKRKEPDYLLIGLLIGCGSLFKWPIFLLWSIIFGMMPYYAFLRSKKVIAGVLISLLGLLPSFTWNIQHGWVTFRHVFYNLHGSDLAKKSGFAIFQGNVWEFLGAQTALLSPILFVLLAITLFAFVRQFNTFPSSARLCGLITFFLLVGALFLSMFKKMQGNWIDYAYPTGITLLCWYACERKPKLLIWLKAGVALSLALCILLLSVPFNFIPIPFKMNPFKHNLGWEALSPALTSVGYDPDKDFLFSSTYQTASILSFYGPKQERAYFLNLHGTRLNQFSFWPGMEQKAGKNGYFVMVDNAPHLQKKIEGAEALKEELGDYFEEVDYLGVKPLYISEGTAVKAALIYRCIGYNGKIPPQPERY